MLVSASHTLMCANARMYIYWEPLFPYKHQISTAKGTVQYLLAM